MILIDKHARLPNWAANISVAMQAIAKMSDSPDRVPTVPTNEIPVVW